MVALGAEAVKLHSSGRGSALAVPSGHKALLYRHIEARYAHGHAVGSAHIHALKPEAVYFEPSAVVYERHYAGARETGVVAQSAPDKEGAHGTLVLGHGGSPHHRGGNKGRDDVELHCLENRTYHSTKISTKNRHRQMTPAQIPRRLWQRLRDSYLWPRICPVCGTSMRAVDSVMCMECLMKLPLCREHGHELLDSRAMATNAILPAATVRAWFHYDPADSYADLIRLMKYGGRSRMGRDMGLLFGRELMTAAYHAHEVPFADVDVLLPVPMHWTKRLRRGYNQSEEIAHGLAAASGAAVADNLVAVRSHGTQTRLSQEARRSNIHECFELRHPSELAGLNIAIVDDIITTGASMGEALRAISHAMPGIASVSLYALGATRRKGY